MPSGFFALFDDIAVLMDDVAAMSKIATKKTAGILADDLAVNADQASGFVSDREIPVLWKIGKASLLNKAIILPFAFLLSAYLPWIIKYILLFGGAYLAYEGVEKIYEYLFHKKGHERQAEIVQLTEAEIMAYENEKVKAAITVDFILSIEIVILALSSVSGQPLATQIPVVTIVAILATVGVYGLVALLVRMDDLGFRLINAREGTEGFREAVGNGLVKTLPILIRILAIAGTVAMILVAGGIFVHNIPFFHHTFPDVPSLILETIIGLLVGIVALGLVMQVTKIFGGKNKIASTSH